MSTLTFDKLNLTLVVNAFLVDFFTRQALMGLRVCGRKFGQEGAHEVIGHEM